MATFRLLGQTLYNVDNLTRIFYGPSLKTRDIAFNGFGHGEETELCAFLVGEVELACC